MLIVWLSREKNLQFPKVRQRSAKMAPVSEIHEGVIRAGQMNNEHDCQCNSSKSLTIVTARMAENAGRGTDHLSSAKLAIASMSAMSRR